LAALGVHFHEREDMTKFRMPKRVLGFVLVAVAAVAMLAATTGGAVTHTMTPSVGANPVVQNLGALNSPANQPGRLRQCQLSGTCQGPDQIRNAYGFQQLLDQGVNGTGRTIVIIDAYGSDTIQQDLATQDSYFGLAPANLNVIYPDGTPSATSVSNRFGWKAETTLDVLSAHAIAPAATIDLVVAKSNDDSDILSATQYVADHNLGDVVSQSYGEAEQCMGTVLESQQHQVFAQLTKENITLLASSGDQGAALPTCDGNGFFKAASSPATDPNVTAVGGTDLITTVPTGVDSNGNPTTTSTSAHPAFEVTPGGQWASESVWNEGVGLSTGGGVSTVYSRPDYQAPVVKDTHMREIPDIAYSGSTGHSILIIMTCTAADAPACGGTGTFVFGFGGTSAGSPQWAGLVALADQMAGGRLGLLNKTLYKLGKGNTAGTYFHDTTVGDNSVPADSSVPGTPITGFSAVPGWDETTGWGTPIANKLVPALAKPGIG
jgi:subtilase family serine protease